MEDLAVGGGGEVHRSAWGGVDVGRRAVVGVEAGRRAGGQYVASHMVWVRWRKENTYFII